MNENKTNKERYRRTRDLAYKVYTETSDATALTGNILGGIGDSLASIADDLHEIRLMMEKENGD